VGLFLDYTIKLTSSNQLLIFTSLTPSSDFIIVVDLENGTIQNKIQLICPGNTALIALPTKFMSLLHMGYLKLTELTRVQLGMVV
jgi:hypothetical protein